MMTEPIAVRGYTVPRFSSQVEGCCLESLAVETLSLSGGIGADS
jgi:hypothetical protein